MGTYHKSNYNVTNYWAGVEEFTTIVNTVNEKYNQATWRNFATWGRRLLIPDFKVNVREANLNVAAAILSVNGQKPLRGALGFKQYGGTIPLIGHGFQMGSADFMALRSFEQDPADPSFNYRFEYMDRFGRALGGMHSRINMMVYQALSSGYVIADAKNNTEAIEALFDLHFNPEHRFAPTKPWSDDEADPIQDMLDIQDLMTDEQIPYTNWLMSKKLIREIAAHPNVRVKIAQKMYPTSTIAGTIPLTRAEVIKGLTEFFEIVPIIEIDEKTSIEVDGKPKVITSFDEKVATLIDPTNFFVLQNCRNIYEDDDNPNILNTMVEEGRFSVIVEYFSNPVKNTTSMESFVLPVPRDPNNVALLKTDATGPWGDRDQMLKTKTPALFGKRGNTSKLANTQSPEAKVVIDGTAYSRTDVIAALNGIGVATHTNTGVTKVQQAVDTLNEEQMDALWNKLSNQ